jgi:hypothetical protein
MLLSLVHRLDRCYPLSITCCCHTAATELPDCVQSVDAGRLLRGQEPILKVLLTQLAGGSGSILAVTLPHTIVGESLLTAHP